MDKKNSLDRNIRECVYKCFIQFENSMIYMGKKKRRFLFPDKDNGTILQKKRDANMEKARLMLQCTCRRQNDTRSHK